LVVEDNPAGVMVLVMLLHLNGLDAEAVYNGSHAVGALERFCPDCVLSDIGLPGLSGLELARRFRAHAAFSRIPLNARSALNDDGQALAAWFDHFLMKPAWSSELIRTVFALRDRSPGPPKSHHNETCGLRQPLPLQP